MNKSLILSTIALIFTGCTLYDPYCRPDLDIPNQWRCEITNAIENSDCWWKEFQDPLLNHFVFMALKKNPTLKEAINSVDAYAAQLQIVRSQLFPQIDLTAGFGRSKSSLEEVPNLPGLKRVSNLFNLLGNINYFADVWGQVRSSVDVAQAQLLAQEEIQKNVVLNLITAVTSTYVALRQYDEMNAIAQETILSRIESYNLAKLRFELGLTSEMPVMQALSELDFTKSQANTLITTIAQLENLLSILIGEFPREIPRGRSLNQLKQPQIPSDLPSDILNQRPDILAAEQKLIAANANIGVARSAFFPQITLTGTFGQASSALSDLFKNITNTWQYGINLLQEIFTGGQLTGNVKLTLAQKEIALFQYQATVLQAFKEVNDALVDHEIAIKQIDVLKERVNSLSSYYNLALLQYGEGEVDYLNVLDAERQFFEAQLDYIDAFSQGFLTTISLYQTIGGNWVTSANQKALHINSQ